MKNHIIYKKINNFKEYDALVIATGVSHEKRSFYGHESQENFYFLRDIQDHQILREKLPSIKNLVIHIFLLLH